jgi:SAM-dependent methyltransferase
MLVHMADLPGERDLLEEINKDLPAGIDWTQGARSYLTDVFRQLGPDAEIYLLIKPFAYVLGDTEESSLETFNRLVSDFVNVLAILKLPVGSRILDIACGSGWMTHFLAKLGYDVIGLDISEEMIGLARKRLKADKHIWRAESQVDGMFVTHDMEQGPLAIDPPADAAIFESSLHHFYDPVTVLRNLRGMLADSGLAVLIEGENRKGALRPYHVEVMEKYKTIERPYSRSQLSAMLQLAGFPAYEFFCPLSAWISPRSEEAGSLPQYVVHHTDNSNRCICAKTPEAIQRILPWWTPHREVDFAPVEGLWWALGNKLWSCPSSRIRALRPLEQLAIDFGSEVPGRAGVAQKISVYTSRGLRHEVILKPNQEQPKRLVIRGISQDEELHLCSDQAFSPAWYGEPDSRLLAFWIEITT